MLCAPTGFVVAVEPTMRFTFSDGSTMVGVLTASNRMGRLQVRSDLFGQRMEISASELLEARLTSPVADAESVAGSEDEAVAFGFSLTDESQLVGTIESWADDRVVLQTKDLGRVEIQRDRIETVVAHSEMPRQILSLATSRHRYRRDAGWKFDEGELVCDSPGAATVGNLDLPNRFRIRMEVRCDGQADFELSLGDRSASGAGKGGQRVDRRGGSLSRLPSERFVTRLEWLGKSVSLVRSNSSVSDAAVFDVSDGEGLLRLDLFFDQTNGRLLAFSDGWLLGEIGLADAEPIIRQVLTLINRGDRIKIDRLDLFQWDGLAPTSRKVPSRFTLLRDGTVLGDVVQEWAADRFRVGGKWYANDELSRMAYGNTSSAATGCELVLSDGCRIRGRLVASAGGKVLSVQETRGNRYAVDPSRVVRLVGNPSDSEVSTAEVAELLAEGVRLRGRLLAGDDVGATFGWRPEVGENELGIIAEQGVEIRSFSSGDRIATGSQGNLLELRSGDQLPGDLMTLDTEGVRFRSGLCGEILVLSQEVSRLRLGSSEPLDDAELALLLRLPRRMKDTPPTHLLISAGGDVLRGRVLSVDDQVARVEIRGRTRTIEREKIAEMVWLDRQPGGDETCKYVVKTSGGAKLGLVTATFDGKELQGIHSVLGECRITAPTIESLKFGEREKSGRKAWQLSPVKEPRSFE